MRGGSCCLRPGDEFRSGYAGIQYGDALLAGVHGVGHDLDGRRHDLPQAVWVEVHRLPRTRTVSLMSLYAGRVLRVLLIVNEDHKQEVSPLSRHRINDLSSGRHIAAVSGTPAPSQIAMPWDTARQ